MKVIEIDIDSIHQPNNLALEFESSNLEKGDRILFKSAGIKEKTFIVMAVLTVVVAALGMYFNKRKEKEFAEKVINDAFENLSIDDIEIEISTRFGVSVSVEDKEDETWSKYSFSQLSNAYSDDEPDYTNQPSVNTNPFFNAN